MQLLFPAPLYRLSRLETGSGPRMFDDDFRRTGSHRWTDADAAPEAARAVTVVVGVKDAGDVRGADDVGRLRLFDDAAVAPVGRPPFCRGRVRFLRVGDLARHPVD